MNRKASSVRNHKKTLSVQVWVRNSISVIENDFLELVDWTNIETAFHLQITICNYVLTQYNNLTGIIPNFYKHDLSTKNSYCGRRRLIRIPQSHSFNVKDEKYWCNIMNVTFWTTWGALGLRVTSKLPSTWHIKEPYLTTSTGPHGTVATHSPKGPILTLT